MLKHFTICAALLALGTGSLSAQQREAVLQKMEVPGTGFDILLAMPKSPAATINLGSVPEAMVIHLIGGELALSFNGEKQMIEALDSLQHPACAFQADSSRGGPSKPVAVYVVAKREVPPAVRTASLDARQPQALMRKVDVPGNAFDIVFAATKSPVGTDPRDRANALAVHAIGTELALATDGDVQKMFSEVGSSQLPACAFEVERKGSNPPQAASVYIVPKG